MREMFPQDRESFSTLPVPIQNLLLCNISSLLTNFQNLPTDKDLVSRSLPYCFGQPSWIHLKKAYPTQKLISY